METKNATPKVAKQHQARPTEKWLVAFAYSIPKKVWGLGDFRRQIVVPRCPICAKQHVYAAEPERRIVECLGWRSSRYLLATAGPLPQPQWADFRNKR
jgi:hypothetical protein